MSYRVMEWARKQKTPDFKCRYVLLELAYFANDKTRLCCPSLATLCEATQIKKKDTVRDAIDRLIEAGLLFKQFDRGDRGQIIRTRYAFPDEAYFFEKNYVSPESVQVSPDAVQVSPLVVQGVSPETGGGVPSDGGRVSPETGRNKEIEQGIEQVTLSRPVEQEIIDEFNSRCRDLPQVKALTEKRKKAINARLKEVGLEGLLKVFDKVAASSFLCGKKSQWRADFDWLLKPSNFQKVSEGNYDDRAPVLELGKKVNGQTQLLTVQQRKEANDWGMW